MDHARIEARPTVRIDDEADLAGAYTPGVAEACRAIVGDPRAARQLTTQGNPVAVISGGSAVLGLGDLGARAALPVLEVKAALFRRFAGIGAWPLCLQA
jgi:malic enzyme